MQTDELSAGAVVAGSKLALLIASMPDAALRQAFAQAAEYADGAQLAVLADLLESAHARSRTSALDTQFQNDIKRLGEKMKAENERLSAKTDKKLDAIARRIP